MALLATLALLPALTAGVPGAAATTGGTTAPSEGGTPPGTSSPAGADSGGSGDASTEAGTISGREGVLLRRALRLSGTLADGHAGTPVRVQRRDAGGGWVDVATTKTGEGGEWTATWRPDATGTHLLRAVGDGSAGATTAGAPPSMEVTVFRPTKSSHFGQGWYGKRTACGVMLRRATLGVAHKTLPCGTRVSFLWRGRTITVPVIDRGPYRAGFTWDLTTATAERLGFADDGIGTVGSLVVERPPAPRRR